MKKIPVNLMARYYSQNGLVSLFFKLIYMRLPWRGRLAVIDLLMYNDRSGSLVPALFALTMFLITQEGACYSFAEIMDWMRDAGFCDLIAKEMLAPYGIVVGRKS